MDEDKFIPYEYQGRIWNLPVELVALQAQMAWADLACKAAVDAKDVAALSDARAERLKKVVEKFRAAASWRESFKGYERWEADWALQAYVRSTLPDTADCPPAEV